MATRKVRPRRQPRPQRARAWLITAAAVGLLAALTSCTENTTHGSGETSSRAAARLLQPENVFGPRSVWRQSVRTAPLASNSAAMVDNLVDQVNAHFHGNAAFNVDRYNGNWYNVGPHEAVTTVKFFNCQHKSGVPKGLYGRGGQFVDVPIPSHAEPAKGTDAQFAVYRPSTDQLWNFWKARHDASGWHACWGGRIDHVSTSAGYFAHGFGASASGLAGEAGSVSITDVRTSSIDHAVSLAIPAPAARGTFTWPAQRSDGDNVGFDALPEGTRLRLNPAIDVVALHLSPIATMIAKAAQTYGFIVPNRSGCVTVPAESGAPVENATGTNPWAHLLGGVQPSQVLKGFPWQDLQVIRAGWNQAATIQATR